MNELSAEYTKAVDLDRRTKVSAQLAQQSIYDMCMGFKEMRDSKLYKELGFAEFGDYCKTELGITDNWNNKADTAYNNSGRNSCRNRRNHRPRKRFCQGAES